MFVVDAPGDSINVLIKMYTASGRLIRSLEAPGGGLGQVQISWDGVDAEGDALANGVYLYKVYVYVRQSDGTSSARQRAIAEGRFVILNP
jgi:flagellar hook assembly protein FlgD